MTQKLVVVWSSLSVPASLVQWRSSHEHSTTGGMCCVHQADVTDYDKTIACLSNLLHRFNALVEKT